MKDKLKIPVLTFDVIVCHCNTFFPYGYELLYSSIVDFCWPDPEPFKNYLDYFVNHVKLLSFEMLLQSVKMVKIARSRNCWADVATSPNKINLKSFSNCF